METYKIQESVEDVIAILDSAPMHLDLVRETNIVQLTNRAPIAHLAIERALKALITGAGGPAKHIHALHVLYRVLGECDKPSAAYLARAFEDAVGFFGYNVKAKGFRQFRTLDDYLSKVGKEKDFEALRYWAIGESPKGEGPIPYISPWIHRELLCALWCLFLPTRRDTVSERVEHVVGRAMVAERGLSYLDSDTRKERSVRWYMSWLQVEHTSCCGALEEAVRRKFAVTDDELVVRTLREAYGDLQQSNDPAVQYYVRTLSYLPKGSQRRNPDATPELQWFDEAQSRGRVVTPAGTHLGFIEKYADGGWGIRSTGDGPVRVAEVARTLTDAKHYLVNRLTRQVTVTVGGESKQLRIVTEWESLPLVWAPRFADPDPYEPKHELEFWDAVHGLRPEQVVSVELQSGRGEGLVSMLKGTVTKVEKQFVTIAGMVTLNPRETVDC